MHSTKRALVVMMLTGLLGMWGCTQNGATPSASTRLRELEAKISRLEDDFKSATAARDQARAKFAQTEDQRQQMVTQLVAMTGERDDWKAQARARTAERDALHSQLSQFGRDLKTMVAKIEEATQSGGTQSPLVSAPLVDVAPTVPGK
jgi:chromosome segregation ATPase